MVKRETAQHVHWGEGRYEFFKVDFVHWEAMAVIELDGPYHFMLTTPEDDALRDEILRALGYRVIRIKHD